MARSGRRAQALMEYCLVVCLVVLVLLGLVKAFGATLGASLEAATGTLEQELGPGVQDAPRSSASSQGVAVAKGTLPADTLPAAGRIRPRRRE